MLDNTGFLCVGDEKVIMKMMMSFILYFRSLMSQKCFKYIKLEILSSRYKTSWASLPSERRPWHGRWWCPWKQCMLDQFVFRDDELPFNDSMTACQWFLRGVDDSWTYFLGAFFFFCFFFVGYGCPASPRWWGVLWAEFDVGGFFSCFDLCLGLRIVSIIVLNGGAVVNQGLPYSWFFFFVTPVAWAWRRVENDRDNAFDVFVKPRSCQRVCGWSWVVSEELDSWRSLFQCANPV